MSQRVGEGPSAATQESRSRLWHSSQGEHSPLLGSWRKEKQFPGAGSDRNTTPPGALETGPESKRTRLLPGSAWALRIRGPSCHPTQELTARTRRAHLLTVLATTVSTLRPHYVNPGKATSPWAPSKQRLFGGRGLERDISGPLRSPAHSSVHLSSPKAPAPSQELVLGRGPLQCLHPTPKNLKNVSVNLRAPGLGSVSPNTWGHMTPGPQELLPGRRGGHLRAPWAPTGIGQKNSLGSPEGRQEALAHPSPTPSSESDPGGGDTSSALASSAWHWVGAKRLPAT